MQTSCTSTTAEVDGSIRPIPNPHGHAFRHGHGLPLLLLRHRIACGTELLELRSHEDLSEALLHQCSMAQVAQRTAELADRQELLGVDRCRWTVSVASVPTRLSHQVGRCGDNLVGCFLRKFRGLSTGKLISGTYPRISMGPLFGQICKNYSATRPKALRQTHLPLKLIAPPKNANYE